MRLSVAQVANMPLGIPSVTRVAIVDDHPVVRDGLRTLLTGSGFFQVVGEASGFRDSKSLVQRGRPDVVLLDLSLEDGSGLEVLAFCLRRTPPPRVLIFSGMSPQRHAIEVLRRGASGFISKLATAAEILEAVQTVAGGRIYLAEGLRDALLDRATEMHAPDPHELLTSRERHVLTRIAKGSSTREIAKELSLDTSTINRNRRKILQKLNLRSDSDLMAYALSKELLLGR